MDCIVGINDTFIAPIITVILLLRYLEPIVKKHITRTIRGNIGNGQAIRYPVLPNMLLICYKNIKMNKLAISY